MRSPRDIGPTATAFDGIGGIGDKLSFVPALGEAVWELPQAIAAKVPFTQLSSLLLDSSARRRSEPTKPFQWRLLLRPDRGLTPSCVIRSPLT